MTPEEFAAFTAKSRDRALRRVTAQVGPDVAEDIVQDAFFSLWQNRETVENPDAYLYGACTNAIKNEYKARKRRSLVAAELQEQDDLEDQMDWPDGVMQEETAEFLMGMVRQKAISVYTAAVAANIAEGHTTQRIAEIMQTPVAEVRRSVRELRQGWKVALDRKSQAAIPSYDIGSTRSIAPRVRLELAKMPRNEGQVMALAALGLKPASIAVLLNITTNSARATLCHARKKVSEAIYRPSKAERPGDVDKAVRGAIGEECLLDLLPDAPWKADYRRLANRSVGRGITRVSSRSGKTVLVDSEIFHLLDDAPAEYLAMMSIVINVAREGLAGNADADAWYGSLRWIPSRVRKRQPKESWSEYGMAFFRLEEVEFGLAAPEVAQKMAVIWGPPAGSFYSCAVPCWPVRPPQFLANIDDTLSMVMLATDMILKRAAALQESRTQQAPSGG